MYIIAEIGQAHDGSLGLAHSYIDALADSGIDAIKFQTHMADAESSIFEPFRVKFSYEDNTRYDYWKRIEFTKEQWVGLKAHCDQKNVEFLASPFSVAAVLLLEDLGVNKYKIGSGEVTNFLMLDRVASTGKEIIMSSGLSSLKELDKTMDFLSGYGNNISLLQCTTAYPTSPDQWGLNMIQFFKDRYKVKVGFSDHSGDIFACLAATALGAEILEAHVVFDKNMFGPDAKASLTVDQFKQLIRGVYDIETAREARSDKNEISKFKQIKQIFEKSLAVNKDLDKGHILTISDLEAKKPAGYGIDARFFDKVIGRALAHNLKQWQFINENDLI